MGATVDDWKSPILIEAVRVWAGWDRFNCPQYEDSLVVSRFGVDVASRLIPVVKFLRAEFYSTDAAVTVSGLPEIGRKAAADFRKKHPEVAEEIVEVLQWGYTFDNK